MSESTQQAERAGWDRRYELRAVSLLAIGFGLVGLDRFIIAPLFPLISEDLGLDYQDLGLVSGALALTWGLAALFLGNLSDRVGYRRVLVSTVIVFSALVAMTGLAGGLLSLLVIRALMGFAEGGFVPASIVATIDASKPTRTGLTVGIQQMAAPLVGLGLGPLIAIGLLRVLPGWEWVFAVVALPGFLVAWLMFRTIRPGAGMTADAAAPPPSYAEALRYRNVIFAALGMLCFLASLHTLSALGPNYLTDHVGLSIEEMGFVLSGMGMGGVVGMIVIPAVSDRLGRTPVMGACMAVAAVALAAVIVADVGAVGLTLLLAIDSAMISGVVAINIGPLLHESVPPKIAATATGIVVGLGEIFGGALTPAVAGGIADALGIHTVPFVSLVAAVLGVAVVLFGLKEPRRAYATSPPDDQSSRRR